MRLLLIEDDADLIRPLTLALKATNFAVDTAIDGERGLFMALTNNYDLILIDYNLPKLNGREVIEKIRADGRSVPIIMITVRSEVDEKVDLLETGADDYITKPFVLSELLARVKAVLRRPVNWQGRVLKFADLELDPDRFVVTKNGGRLILSAKEFALLEYLMAHVGRILSRQEIMEHVWDENADPFSNTIEVHIMKLRQKIETEGRRFIYTVSGRGYKLDEQK